MLLCLASPAIGLPPGFEKKWAGVWSIGAQPRSDEEFRRSGPSFEFAVTEVSAQGFSYLYGGNPMGYGLDWSAIMEGHASFQGATSALVGDRVDQSILDRSYADRLATLEKLADPILGRSPGVDAAYVAGSYGKAASLWDDTAFVLGLARSRIRRVGLTDRPALTLDLVTSGVIVSGSYENWDNIFTGDGWNTAWSNYFAILVLADGEVWTVEIEAEIPEGLAENGRDFEREYYRFGELEVWGPGGKCEDETSWPASIVAWLDRHRSELRPAHSCKTEVCFAPALEPQSTCLPEPVSYILEA